MNTVYYLHHHIFLVYLKFPLAWFKEAHMYMKHHGQRTLGSECARSHFWGQGKIAQSGSMDIMHWVWVGEGRGINI